LWSVSLLVCVLGKIFFCDAKEWGVGADLSGQRKISLSGKGDPSFFLENKVCGFIVVVLYSSLVLLVHLSLW